MQLKQAFGEFQFAAKKIDELAIDAKSEVDADLKRRNEEMEKIIMEKMEGVREIEESIEELGAKEDDQRRTLGRLEMEENDIRRIIKRLQQDANEISDARIAKAEDKLKVAEQRQRETMETISRLCVEEADIRRMVQRLQSEERELQNSIQTRQATLSNLEIDLQSVKSQVTQIQGSINRGEDRIAELNGRVMERERRVEELERNIQQTEITANERKAEADALEEQIEALEGRLKQMDEHPGSLDLEIKEKENTLWNMRTLATAIQQPSNTPKDMSNEPAVDNSFNPSIQQIPPRNRRLSIDHTPQETSPILPRLRSRGPPEDPTQSQLLPRRPSLPTSALLVEEGKRRRVSQGGDLEDENQTENMGGVDVGEVVGVDERGDDLE